jgi:hypothetical protein
MGKGINRGNEIGSRNRCRNRNRNRNRMQKNSGINYYKEEELLIWNLWRERNRKKREFFQRTGSKDWGFSDRRIRERKDEKGGGGRT